MDSHSIRASFLNFFKERGHTVKEPSSLIPEDDPTLLFTGAGMNQFKKEFLGIGEKTLKRAATCQKCFRTSDIDTIGKSSLHHTFFEMLGNFSFGDYFKKEAILWAWQFVREVFRLSEKSLWISIYVEDEESFRIWRDEVGVQGNRIVRLGKEHNWWDMGEVGPCGPCSEIIVDRGEELGCGKEECDITCDCGRYLELWNLVFTQFDRKKDGKLEPLPQKNIDTGMGLERAAAIMQNVDDNFLTDLFSPIVEKISGMARVGYEKNYKKLLRIISDHSRAITFLISDGVFPSNEGRGYVLRRLIRKALRQGEILNIKLPFLYKIVPEIVRVMGSTYLDLKERKEHVIQVLKSEEDSYKRTIEEGSKVLDEIFQRQRRKNETVIAGEDLFKLYDTYGLPPEVVEEIAQDEGFTVDIKGFYLKMRSQKEKGRLAWVKGERKIIEAGEIYVHLANRFDSTKFVGYENLDYTSRILAIIKEGKEYHGRIKKGEEFEFITDATPFYAEMGGQVSDTGSFQMGEAKGNIINARYEKDGLIVHHARIDEGQTPVVEKIYLCVDKKRRQSIACHHTATHLLQYALRTMLGSHIQQSGSLVEESYLRFDFSHFSPIRKEELLKVEEMVNELIRKNLAVKTEYMKLGEAKKTGALSFFGEKYGEIVRVVSIGQISRELCGGTHTQHTGEIGLFHILNESSIGKSLRRIEAVAAYPAYQRIRDKLHTLEKISFLLKTSPDAVDRRIQELIDEKKFLTREVDALREKFLVEKIKELPETAKSVEGIKVIGARLDGIDREVLRNLLDVLKNKMKSSSVILLGGVKDKKILLVGGLTTDLVKKGFHMGKIIKEVAKIAGGSGGGREDMAEGGARDINALDKALEAIENIVRRELKR